MINGGMGLGRSLIGLESLFISMSKFSYMWDIING